MLSSLSCAAITTTKFQNNFITPQRNPPHKAVTSTPPPPQPLEPTDLLSMSMGFPVLDISLK